MQESESPVSVVIPCYNPGDFLREALAGVWAQTLPPAEVILVNDGSDQTAALKLLDSLSHPRLTRIDQPNRGPAAARNAGFRAARTPLILPLDVDDRLAPPFLAECAAALAAHPEAAFVYTDYRVFGERRYVERLPDYNLYDLLHSNAIPYASVIRRADWELAGGYDETIRVNYEDWEFWLRLAEQERFGHHLPRVLFHYRRSRQSNFVEASKTDRELRARIRAAHPRLYSREGRAAIKARWSPAVCIVDAAPAARPLLADAEQRAGSAPAALLQNSRAPAFLFSPADPHDAEFAALAVWGGKPVVRLADGALCVSRETLATVQDVSQLVEDMAAPRRPPAPWLRRWERLHRHLVNAEINSLASLPRLIPLRFKERVNRLAGRPLFDLSFYLRFQPASVLTASAIVPLLRYFPPPAERRRVGIVHPHLGPGGAESVLLDLAGALDRRRHEIFVLATQSGDSLWRPRWEAVADHVYDLAALVPPERMVAAVCSVAANWEFDTLIVQNSLAGYSALPHLRRERPGLQIIDLIHAVHPTWDFVSSTAAVAGCIDLRVAISDAARRRLLQAGTPPAKIRLIRNGVDLDRFREAPPRPASARPTILFAGRLEAVKHPLLLADIAAELLQLRPGADFHIVVAGDGPERGALQTRVASAGLAPIFEFLGHVDAMPEVLADADVLVLPSRDEGVPLIVIEAFAAGRPVVCARVGAVAEAVDAATGILIEPGEGEAARFAAALAGLLSDPAARARMGRAARQQVEEAFDLREARRAYRTLIDG